MADKKDDEKATAEQAQATEQRPADNVRMNLMEQAKALQEMAAQAAREATMLPEDRLDMRYTEPLTQVFEFRGPDGKVYARRNANGEEVDADGKVKK